MILLDENKNILAWKWERSQIYLELQTPTINSQIEGTDELPVSCYLCLIAKEWLSVFNPLATEY